MENQSLISADPVQKQRRLRICLLTFLNSNFVAYSVMGIIATASLLLPHLNTSDLLISDLINY